MSNVTDFTGRTRVPFTAEELLERAYNSAQDAEYEHVLVLMRKPDGQLEVRMTSPDLRDALISLEQAKHLVIDSTLMPRGVAQ